MAIDRRRALEATATSIVLALLYVAVYRFFQRLGVYQGLIAFNPWLFYPPAFIKLFAFLLAGYWALPWIIAAAFVCIDFGVDPNGRIVLAVLSISAAFAGADAASRALKINPSLEGVSAKDLLILSIASSAANAAALRVGLEITAFEKALMPDYLSIIVGDTLGIWCMIYAIKMALHAIAPTRRA